MKKEGSSKKPGCKYSKLKLNAEKIYSMSTLNIKYLDYVIFMTVKKVV